MTTGRGCDGVSVIDGALEPCRACNPYRVAMGGAHGMPGDGVGVRDISSVHIDTWSAGDIVRVSWAKRASTRARTCVSGEVMSVFALQEESTHPHT